MTNPHLYLGETPARTETPIVTGDYIDLLGETYYRIQHYTQMPPFFMSLVSSSNHWFFISSTGGLTAGRTSTETALFPYETDDKIAAGSDHTGSKTIFRVQRGEKTHLWEPFSLHCAGLYQCEHHLYKNIYGNKLVFEEINHTLQIIYRYAWRTSDRFGFVKSSWLQNTGTEPCEISVLDGLQNLLPYGATTRLQTTMSNLLHAYKRSELETATGLGIFTLSATLTDRAEPSESLKATVAWQVGLKPTLYLFCSNQIATFRRGEALLSETDICGRPGAYLVNADLTLAANQTHTWHIVADVDQDSSDVATLVQYLHTNSQLLINQLEADIATGTDDLIRLMAAADGLQLSADKLTTTHHFANVLFNSMRGGIFANGYRVAKDDLLDFIQIRNRSVLAIHQTWFESLPVTFTLQELYALIADQLDPNLQRLCFEYLPLTFSRRHGDPSRPWNQFSINLKNSNGSPRFDYQGNWRDIFQNWEPLVYAFPAYTEAIIAKFVNATTADGYNPYRITRAGIEWEKPEPDNPWSNIGYWNDHQIIYLQKLLEFSARVHPGKLQSFWNRPIFSYANIPYRLRSYQAMLQDWYNTIDFDWDSEQKTMQTVAKIGTDGRLLCDADDAVIHVTMVEKLLVLLLAKLTNLVPEGGIWMNTQRPEWNDANNALVGKGLSVVTTAYLRRFVAGWRDQLIAADEEQSFTVNSAVGALFTAVGAVFTEYQAGLTDSFSPQTRRGMMDALGTAATAYRETIYHQIPQSQQGINRQQLTDFLVLAQNHLEHTLQANRRPDGLYHAYNILRVANNGVFVDYLYPMLEGQVAILSAGILSPAESLSLLHGMRQSELYRADQHTYMLYPNRTLPGFLQKNHLPANAVANSALVQVLTDADDRRLLRRDQTGTYHFNGTFRNAADVESALAELAADPRYADLVAADRTLILDLFEQTFNHRAFTGRSGTFFAYEGLGSVYWHMVSKLLLAAQECYQTAVSANADTETIAGLVTAYYDIRQGLGFNKTPVEYGTFPTDPYSHTPANSGARQPGMTGQVKEEILTRWGELGINIIHGQIQFVPCLLRYEEFLTTDDLFTFIDCNKQSRTFSLPVNSLAFTFCQTPIIYTLGDTRHLIITGSDGHQEIIPGNQLDTVTSQHIFNRDGYIQEVKVVLMKIGLM